MTIGWDFPGDPVVKTPCFQSVGAGSIPGQGTRIPRTAQWRSQKKIRKTQHRKGKKSDHWISKLGIFSEGVGAEVRL